MRGFHGYNIRYGIGICILIMSGIAQAQHGRVSYNKAVRYTLDNSPKLDEIIQLLKDLYLRGRDEYRIGVIDETIIRDNNLQMWEEQTNSIVEQPGGYESVLDPNYMLMSQQLSGILTALEKRIRGREFDWKSEDNEDEEELKSRYQPGEPFMRGPGPPHFDLLGGAESNIAKLSELNQLNQDILTTKIVVPANFYRRDLDDRPEVPGDTQSVSIWDALILLMWDPHDKGEGTALELTTWIYALEGWEDMGFYDVAGRYNLYLTVKGIYEMLSKFSWSLKDKSKSFFWNVYEKEHYEFAPIWDLTQKMVKLLQFYRDRSLQLLLLLEPLPTLMPAPVRPQIQGPQGAPN
ncbi:hypothetical protein TWF192_000057 [Orbilia oligospora]|uniref:Uncharacterized protein n=1 Tax=Orbilia oligospora TaxID=2813651 RepID=A0A6G1MNB2_ORBOL|nr:hypothetical protein TWF191_011035 [Orbilia oligospora]KAF3265407.1 hypothetical protein TWF192_000057 [Orbilia oligospora]